MGSKQVQTVYCDFTTPAAGAPGNKNGRMLIIHILTLTHNFSFSEVDWLSRRKIKSSVLLRPEKPAIFGNLCSDSV